MIRGQKVSFLEMNLAQQQQASVEMQRRLAETEYAQKQLLMELRELKGQKKEDTPGVPEGAAEVREFAPADEVHPKDSFSDGAITREEQVTSEEHGS